MIFLGFVCLSQLNVARTCQMLNHNQNVQDGMYIKHLVPALMHCLNVCFRVHVTTITCTLYKVLAYLFFLIRGVIVIFGYPLTPL